MGPPRASSLLTSAAELLPSQLNEPQPEAQPLIFMLPEMGSGEGSRRSNSKSSTSFSIDPSSSVTDADMAPALIEARCWNNYENDNDCKQLNVISAPQGENQNSQQQDDSIITPVVIFEASSSVEPPLDNQVEPERPVFMAPPYQSNEIPQRHNTKIHKQQPGRAQTSTSPYAATAEYPERDSDSPTFPSVINHVATPRPTVSSGGPKSTTPDRKCRDENDEDCDEDEDNSIRGPSQSGPANGHDESEDDDGDEEGGLDVDGKRRANPIGADASDGQSNLIGESGSGLGPGGTQTDDDTDDSKDDGDAESTEDTGESSGASSIQENTSQSSDGRLLVITSSYSPEPTIDNTAKPSSGAEVQQVPVATTSRPVSRRPQSGAAEIEVVVHSTLPPSFPGGRSKGPHGVLITNFEPPSSTTTTTMMPIEEIVTSRPTFPPTTVDNSPTFSPEGPDRERFPPAARTNQSAQMTTEADLFTFKPIPIPVETETRPPRFDPLDSKQDVQAGSPTRPGIGPQHIHEPVDRRPFDLGWTTRRPQSSVPSLAGSNPVGNSADLLAGSGNGWMQPKSKAIYMPTETLPTMLLYASIIVTVFISLILVVIYSLWRRNSLRRRALLAKAHMMNGRTPTGMIESMSHVSHLMHGPDGMPPQQPPQQGLLSTYAPTKGSAIGKVTTSLVKPIGQSESGLLNQELDEEEEGDDDDDRRQVFKDGSKDELANGIEDSSLEEAQNQHRSSRLNNGINEPMQNRSGSWSTEDPTTTTSSGSQRTQDSQVNMQQRQQGQLMQNSPHLRHPYPNSLSDGRQNSSSISDSQCSPDPQPSSGPAMGPIQHLQQPLGLPPPSQPLHMLSPMHNNNQHMMAAPVRLAGHNQQAYELHQRNQLQQQQPHIRPILRSPHANGLPRMGPGPSLMSPVGSQARPMMVQSNGQMDGLKHRLVTSRSIEDIPPQHVGFVDSNHHQQYMPYNQHQQVGLPHLIRAKPLYQHPGANVAMNSSPTFRSPLVSSQRIAMSPLATLGRRIPPGAGLNRNVYSEDSSSFMTASPSLARTSSSSSFAFNLSNLPTPSSIKARHIVDNSGRVFNDYTQGLGGHANGSSIDTSAVSTGPPVFGPGDRGEPWYV